jgi:hypothetical protein
MHFGENYITFKISSDGKVQESLERRIQSTSWEMEQILRKIVPKVAEYMETLLRDELQAMTFEA